MATFKIYKLHFTAPLHIGSQREDEGYSMNTIQSDLQRQDTLFPKTETWDSR